MCGIVGWMDKGNKPNGGVFDTMCSVLAHRGPDDFGTYLSTSEHVRLGHRRLSFFDLSVAGRQPMVNADGRLAVTFNGEIYNFTELRAELQAMGFRFDTQTDTEVLLHGYVAWGHALPGKLKGMFAFALWDDAAQKLLLVRDRFGIKPLFYAQWGDTFAFASEVKPFLRIPGFPKQIRRESVGLFLANRYVPVPNTLWQHVFKLPPAHWMEVDARTLKTHLHRYWSLEVKEVPHDARTLSQDIQHKMEESVAQHIRSDVPVGSFLSGGMDSTALVYLMKKVSTEPVDAFSIGFTGWPESEHLYAQKAADALGARLHTLLLEQISMDTVHRLMQHYDDPIADISILPTYAVSGLAHRHVKAVLSGEGADECFGGYWWQQPSRFWYANARSKWKARLTGKSFAQIKAHYIQAMSMGLFDAPELGAAFTPEWQDAVPADPFAHFDAFRLPNVGTLKQIQYLDIHTFMPELILNKVDRASMAHSLEVRVPFLDHELVEFMFSLPQKAYFDPKVQKTRIREILQGHVPQEIYQRPKQGFVGPDRFYMNFDVYRDALPQGRLVTDGVIRPAYLERLFETRDHWRLWKLFVLEHWWQIWV